MVLHLDAVVRRTARRLGRSQRLASGVATNAVSYAVTAFVQLALIWISLSYIGAELYGLWAAVIALMNMAAFADLGLGVGLMTKLALALSEGQTEKARRYISSAYSTLTAVALGATALLWLTADAIPWSSLLSRAGSVTPSQARTVFLVCLTSFIVKLPLTLIVRVQYACQQAARSNLWQAATSLGAVPLVLLAVGTGSSPIAVITAASGGPVLVSAINNAWFFWRRRELRPRFLLPGRADARELFGLSFVFLILTSLISAADNLDTFIVAHTSGLPAVTTYTVSAKVAALLGLVTSLFVLPLWPANAEALVQGQLDWMRRTARRVMAISVGAVLVMAAFLALAGTAVLRLWVGNVAGNDRWLLIGFAIWFLLKALFTPLTLVQYAAGRIGLQVLGWSLYLALSLPAKWYGCAHFGVTWIPYIGSAIFVLTVAPSTLLGYKRTLSEARRAAEERYSRLVTADPETHVAAAGPAA